MSEINDGHAVTNLPSRNLLCTGAYVQCATAPNSHDGRPTTTTVLPSTRRESRFLHIPHVLPVTTLQDYHPQISLMRKALLTNLKHLLE